MATKKVAISHESDAVAKQKGVVMLEIRKSL